MPTPVVVYAPPKQGKDSCQKTKTRVIPIEPNVKSREIETGEAVHHGHPGQRVSFFGKPRDERISRNDISASPRLLGYLVCCVTSIVCLVSILIYEDKPDVIRNVMTSYIFDWKIEGGKIVSAIGTGFTGIVILAHLDKRIIPDFWVYVFGDGSRVELVLILLHIALWITGVYFCTTPFSPGEIVHNVYFASWFALVSTVYLLKEWLLCAGRHSPFDYIRYRTSRKAFYWVLLVLLACVSFEAAMEIYGYRDSVYRYFGIGKLSDTSDDKWVEWLSVSGAQLGISITGLFLHFLGDRSSQFGCQSCSTTIHWQLLEGLLTVGFIALNGYSVFAYTGIEGYLNSPTNPYFSLWGLLFVSILTFHVWLTEHNMLIISISKENVCGIFSRKRSPNNTSPISSSNEAASATDKSKPPGSSQSASTNKVSS